MKKNIYLIFLAGIVSFNGLHAQDKGPGKHNALFQSDTLLKLELKADLKTVFSNTDDSTNFPASISVVDNKGIARTMNINIRTRGKTRRDKHICSFAPLRLNFSGADTKDTPFEGQKVLKLVTHCDRGENYEQNTILEYLIYKAFNILTDSSFKVRPTMISYIIENKKTDTVTKFGFFIEREKYLARRLHGVEVKPDMIHPANLDAFQTCLVDVFEYMIGNTDYSIYELHNIMLIADSTEKPPVFPVPYDFDWSGVVSANYAVPNPKMNTETVKERVYRGVRQDPVIVNQVVRLFKEKQEQIYSVFQNYEWLDKDEKKSVIRYLDDFFWEISNEKRAEHVFIDSARVPHD